MAEIEPIVGRYLRLALEGRPHRLDLRRALGAQAGGAPTRARLALSTAPDRPAEAVDLGALEIGRDEGIVVQLQPTAAGRC